MVVIHRMKDLRYAVGVQPPAAEFYFPLAQSQVYGVSVVGERTHSGGGAGISAAAKRSLLS